METLLNKWLELKSAERKAKEAREDVEAEIYMALKDEMNDESQATWNLDKHKLVIKPNWSVSVNQEMASQYADLFKTKYEMSYAQYKKCNNMAVVNEIVTIKQTKPTFSVEVK